MAASVLNLTGTASAARLEMLLPNTAGIGIDWHMVSKSLAAESAAGTLDAIAAGQQSLSLLPWIPLMMGGDQPEVLTRWKELAAAEPSVRRRSQFGGLALIFANLAQCLPQWKDALEGWNVEECEIVLEWQEQGRQRGLQQGRQEGLQQGLQDALQVVLEQRFTAPLPADILSRVQGATDVAELRRWLNLASTLASLDELRSALGIERPV